MSNLTNIAFDSEPVYGDNYKYKKEKIKMYGVPKENVSYVFLSLITLESAIKVNKKYYPHF